MSGWPRVLLSEVSSLIDYGYTTSAADLPIGPKFLRITDIQDGHVNWDSVPFCKCSAADEADYKLKPGDIVFARTGATTGKSFFIRKCPDRAVFASYLIRVRPAANILPDYLAYFFQTPDYWSQISLSARGAAQAGVNASSLRRLSLPLPPLADQQRIAEFLDRAERLRNKRQAVLSHLDELSWTIFVDMFGDPNSKYVQWPSLHLREALLTPLRNGLSPSTGGAVVGQVLTLSSITGPGFDETAVKTSTFRSNPLPLQTVDKDDFLICRGNGSLRLVGRGHFPTRTMPDVAFPDTMIAARLSSALVDRAFMQHIWNSSSVRQQIEASARTTNGTLKVNQTMLEGTVFICPPPHSQREFARRISSLDKLKTAQRASLAELDALFASLQDRAFRGEL